MKEIYHEYTDEIICPHCGEEMMDSWEYSEDGEDECWECGKKFSYSRYTSVSYSTKKI